MSEVEAPPAEVPAEEAPAVEPEHKEPEMLKMWKAAEKPVSDLIKF